MLDRVIHAAANAEFDGARVSLRQFSRFFFTTSSLFSGLNSRSAVPANGAFEPERL